MRNQSWAKPGLVCFRRFASLCVGGVGAAGLQIGTGSVNQGGPRTWEQRYLGPNSGRRWRMAQGDSTLPRPTKDNQRSSRAAPGVESPVVGIRGPLGIRHRRTDCASPRGAYPKRAPHRAAPGGPRLLVVCSPAARRHQVPPPSRGPTRHRQAPPPDAPIRTPPLQGGPASESDAGRSTPPNPGSQPQSGGDLVGPGPRRGAQVRWRPSPGPRPHSSSPGRTSRSPSVLPHGELPSPARPGPARRQGRGLSPQSRAAPVTREPAPGGESAPQRSPPSAAVVPLLSGHEIARFSASRHPFKVGPSGAEQLSVRHARLRGHATSSDYTVHSNFDHYCVLLFCLNF
ncbi:hypothetical protein NDU88_003002 [Pleurodeles waltl]|uniref:Uncharacterized protein n=1 Tax=Pleurodeles waltl TaxID=8319 RepID=A0AAV7MPY2_PLEWA|nr:hypothetical protein NDU88_003002 [Pleurodeles waltl]